MHQFSDNSRVWIFQADRELSPDEIKWAFPKLQGFINEWKAHGHALAARVEIRYNRFIIVMVDEDAAAASGCSIDTLHRFMQELEKALGIRLFDRFNIAYKEDGKVVSVNRETFEELLRTSRVNETTIVFNNLAATKKALDENWEVPLGESWHSQVFKT
ncbi:MAG TPA: ABC transporter ATPase [Anseongella sp.]|nr:ABC transporter ATPase [Anseongella sp.]